MRSHVRLVAGLLATFLVMGFMFVMPTAALAAPNQVQIDDLTFVSESGAPTTEFDDGSLQKL